MKKKTIGITIGIFITGVALFGYQTITDNTYTEIPENAPVTYAHASNAFDVDNQAKLADFSTNVFIGIVEERKGSREVDDTLIYTDAVVRVIQNIKGEITDKRVMVTQYGGYDQDEGSLVLMEGDRLYQKGETYVFFTSESDKDANVFHVVTPQQGKVALTTPEDLKTKVDRIVVKESKGALIAENDYEIQVATIAALTLQGAVQTVQKSVAEANANPGMWKK